MAKPTGTDPPAKGSPVHFHLPGVYADPVTALVTAVHGDELARVDVTAFPPGVKPETFGLVPRRDLAGPNDCSWSWPPREPAPTAPSE